MLAFIDESGDSGLSLGSSSSPHLILTLVLFDDLQEAQRADERIGTLRREFGVHSDFEFHFTKLKQDWRERFLKELGVFEFSYFSIVIDKSQVHRHGLTTPAQLYRHACHLAIQLASLYLNEAIVVMDGSGSRTFRQELASEIRRNARHDTGTHVRKFKLQDSHRNNLLQLADMVCGAVARSFTTKPDADAYRKLIRHCESAVVRWPS